MQPLYSLLEWLLPAGSIGAVLVWLTSRRLRRATTQHQVHEAYKKMYDDVCTTLHALQDDNTRLYLMLQHLERLMLRATACPHYERCPINEHQQPLPN